MVGALFHILVGLLGFSLLYVSLFLHENEEGQLQNRLEELWVAIDDLSKTALSKQTAFVQQVSALANSALNRLFGAKLFSPTAVSASFCFSASSVLLFLLYPMYENWLHHVNVSGPGPFLSVLTLFILSFLVGLSRPPFRYLGLLWLPGSFAFLLWLSWSDHRGSHNWNWSEILREFLVFSVPLIGGFLSDVLFIALSRWCLRKSSGLKNGWKITALVSLNGCVGIALIAPLVLESTSVQNRIHFYGEVHDSLVLLALSNIVTGVIALLFFALAITSLAHLAAWPILERPVYALQRFGIARQPKLLAFAAVTCLMSAWPNSPVVHGITKLIRLG